MGDDGIGWEMMGDEEWGEMETGGRWEIVEEGKWCALGQ